MIFRNFNGKRHPNFAASVLQVHIPGPYLPRRVELGALRQRVHPGYAGRDDPYIYIYIYVYTYNFYIYIYIIYANHKNIVDIVDMVRTCQNVSF